MSKKQDGKKQDGRSVSSKTNIRKAQQTKAERQREIKNEIDAFTKKIKSEKLPKSKPELKRTKNSFRQEEESDEESSSSDEEIVISSRGIKKDKQPRRDHSDEIEALKQEIESLKTQKPKRAPRKRKPIEDTQTVYQPIQQQPIQPIVHIHNPAPQVIETKPNELVQKMREGLLRFD